MLELEVSAGVPWDGLAATLRAAAAALQPCSPATLQPCQPCKPTSQVSAGLPSPDSLKAALGLGAGSVSPKMDAALGGGNFMGQGCYAVSMARHLPG